MRLHRLAALAALPCLCLAPAAAGAQSRTAVRAPAFDLRSMPAAEEEADYRIRSNGPASVRRSNMFQSWQMEGGGEVGFGRFLVPNEARPRTHTERIRGGIDPDTRRIVGAGMQLRF